jgi:hypothetical protein
MVLRPVDSNNVFWQASVVKYFPDSTHTYLYFDSEEKMMTCFHTDWSQNVSGSIFHRNFASVKPIS